MYNNIDSIEKNLPQREDLLKKYRIQWDDAWNSDISQYESAYCDYLTETGKCYGIYVYSCYDGIERRFNECWDGTADITEAIAGYISGELSREETCLMIHQIIEER